MLDVSEFIKESREVRRAHLALTESCIERGGNSTNHKGVLAQYLDTTIPKGRILLCHACHNVIVVTQSICTGELIKIILQSTGQNNPVDLRVLGREWLKNTDTKKLVTGTVVKC